MTVHKVTLCGPCSNTFCYQHGCIKQKTQMLTLGPGKVSDITHCLQVLADQPLSIEDEHARITSTDIVEALQQQADEMVRIDDAIKKARQILKRTT